MKWMTLLLTLLLVSCTHTDNVAYQQIVVPSPHHKLGWWDNNPSIDVTTTTIKYL